MKKGVFLCGVFLVLLGFFFYSYEWKNIERYVIDPGYNPGELSFYQDTNSGYKPPTYDTRTITYRYPLIFSILTLSLGVSITVFSFKNGKK